MLIFTVFLHSLQNVKRNLSTPCSRNKFKWEKNSGGANVTKSAKVSQQSPQTNIEHASSGSAPHSPKTGDRIGKSGASVPKSGTRLIRKLELNKTATKTPKTSTPGNTKTCPKTMVESDGFSQAFHKFSFPISDS